MTRFTVANQTRGRMSGAACAVLLVLLGGCSEPSGDGPSASLAADPSVSSTSSSATAGNSASTAPSSTRSEQLDPERQAVVDAYKGFFDAVYSLKSPTDAEVVAALSPFGDGPIVQHWVTVFQKLNEVGREPSGHVSYGPMQVSIQGNNALIVECRDGTTETVIDKTTGEVVGQGEPNTKFESKMIRGAHGGWLVKTSDGTADGC